MFFMGTYTPKLDDKGRLFLPAKFRDRLAEGLVVTQGQENCLVVWPTDVFMEEARRAQATPMTVRGARDYARILFAGADEGSLDKQGRIGIQTEQRAAAVSVGGAFGRTFTLMGDFMSSTVSAIGGIPHEVHQIFAGEQRGSNSAASVVDVARVSGQITASGASTGDIVASLLLIIAELNLFVGVFNLLPLLPLDGGHVAILAFEEARARVYRVVGRRDPGRVDIMKVLPVTYAFFALLVGLSLIMLYAGVTNPISIQ